MNNIGGFCADTCSLMMGPNESISTILKSNIPNLIIVNCNCHIEHLCARYAMDALPDRIKDLASNIAKYINGSSKRVTVWNIHQIDSGIKSHKVPKAAFTRWLTLADCINYVLEKWTALKEFFRLEFVEKKERIASYIYNELNDDYLYLFFLFANFILPKFANLNKQMQSVTSIIPANLDAMSNLLNEILSLYMDKRCFKQDLKNIDPYNLNKMKPLAEINVGDDALEFISKNKVISKDDINNFLLSCRDFYAEACSQLKNRLSLDEKWFSCRSTLNPENALCPLFHKKNKTLSKIFDALPGLHENEKIKEEINDEWENLCSFNFSDEIKKEKNFEKFWLKIKKYSQFEYLCNYVFAVFSIIPNSNASVERIWSLLTLQDTKTRSRLQFLSIRAILLSRQFLIDQGGILNFEPSRDMILDTAYLRLKKHRIIRNRSNRTFEADYIRKCRLDKIHFKPPRNSSKIMKQKLQRNIIVATDSEQKAFAQVEDALLSNLQGMLFSNYPHIK